MKLVINKIIIILLLIIVPALETNARGGEGGSSSGGSGSSSSGGYSSSSNHISSAAYQNNHSSLSLKNINFFLLLLSPILIFATIGPIKKTLLKRKLLKNNAEIINSLNELYEEQPIEQFTQNFILENSNKIFSFVQQSWQKRNIDDYKHLITDNFYDKCIKDFEFMKQRHEINIIENFNISGIVISKLETEPEKEITVKITGTILDYYVDDRIILQDEKLIKGDNTVFEDFYTFIFQNNTWKLDRIINTDLN
jgi:hypothetical protein